MKNTNQYAIISHDRHRDDYVYIVDCPEDELSYIIRKIWSKDFPCHGEPNECNRLSVGDSSGDYSVGVAIIKTIK
jgi:hypothetical protein